MKYVNSLSLAILVGILVISCEPKQQANPILTLIASTALSTNTLPQQTITPTEIECPPSPLGQELPLPQNIEDFIGRYYGTPGRVIEGMEFFGYVLVGFETYIDENGESHIRDKGYIVGSALMGDKYMLWLEKRICSIKGTDLSPQSYSFYQVVDAVELPRRVVYENILSLNTCLVNGVLDPETYGFGEVTDESDAPSEPLYAWKADIENEELIPIETQNVKCYFALLYPKP